MTKTYRFKWYNKQDRRARLKYYLDIAWVEAVLFKKKPLHTPKEMKRLL